MTTGSKQREDEDSIEDGNIKKVRTLIIEHTLGCRFLHYRSLSNIQRAEYYMSLTTLDSDSPHQGKDAASRSTMWSPSGTKVLTLIALVFALIALVMSCSSVLRDESNAKEANAGSDELAVTCPASAITPQQPTNSDGAPGATGSPGAAGNPGDPGPSGEAGAGGLNGLSGSPGPVGATGSDGRMGATGEPGTDGVDGLDGTDGLDGHSGTDGLDGSGSVGLAGSPGEPGPQGAPGLQGEPGPAGPQGATGSCTGLTLGAPCSFSQAGNEMNGVVAWVDQGNKADLQCVVQ
jgi:hypothetical protein